jgi:macrolide transport system ATP-binding/permease protein
MNRLWQDLRYAARTLAKNPGFSVLAVLLMAIGIGVNTTVFSVMDCLFLRSLPVQDPDQIVKLDAKRQGRYQSFSYAEYEEIRRQSTSYAGILASSRHVAMLYRDGETEIIRADYVSDNYFSVLGVNPALGQGFAPANRQNVGEKPQVIISHGLWQRRFGSDPVIAGKTIIVNKREAIIRGVAPSSFGGLQRGLVITEIWMPVSRWLSSVERENREIQDYDLLGRLQPDTKLESARAELNTIAGRLAAAFPETNRGVSYYASRVENDIFSSFLYGSVVLSGPFLILLICCANVSGMGLARADARQNEIAVRLALGSGQRRLLRQLLTESLLLVIPGAGLGLLLTSWLINLQSALMPPMPFIMRFDLRLDMRVILFALIASMAAVLLSGLAPALRAAKVQLSTLLKGAEGRTGSRGYGLIFRNTLVAGQVALSLTLLIATGLFLKSLILSEQINPGFDTGKKLLIVETAPAMHPLENSQRFFLPAIEQIKSLPGVKGATYALRVPLSGSGGGISCEVTIPGVENPEGQKGFIIKYNSVGREYFRTVGAHINRGRDFDAGDELPDRRTAIINETMAKRFWPDGNSIGSFIKVKENTYQIVGIAQDGRIVNLREDPEAYIYFPFAQFPRTEASIIVETTGDPLDLVASVKSKVRSVDNSTIIIGTETLKNMMALALYAERIAALASATLGVLGILLTAVGLYGILAYIARRRTHEIGIRIALGARNRDISKLVIGKGFRIATIGVAVGLIISFFAMRLISTALYGVAPTDVWIFSASALVVLAISLLASYIPARRAAKVNPAVALRYE